MQPSPRPAEHGCRALTCATLLALLGGLGCGDFALVGISSRHEISAADGGRPRDAAATGVTSPGADAGALVTAGTSTRSVIDACAAGSTALDAATLDALLHHAQADASLRYLYPYDGTVFPAGLPAPLLMWDGPSADAVYLHLQSQRFEYRGCLRPSADHQLAVPQQAWDAAAAAGGGASDPLDLELTSYGGGRASGPVREQVILARAGLRGSVYYMSYGLGPTIVRTRATGATQAWLGASACTGCHALSANGTRLLAYTNGGGGLFALTAKSQPEAAPLSTMAPGAELAGLYPDGSLYVATAHAAPTAPRSLGAYQQTDAALFETDTGTRLPDAGIPTGATLPAFAPSGLLLVFNDRAINGGHGLALMDFSVAARKASNYRVLYTDSDSDHYPGWPSFLPDSSAVVFARGASSDFSGNGAHFSGSTSAGPSSDLYLVDVTSQKSVLLARAMGYRHEGDADSATYLPFGASELHQSYYPTSAPVASGGYAWVFFDSIRNYGNQGVKRQIWGAALELRPQPGYASDPSHPAFHLAGQDGAAVNVRPVAALDPCLRAGQSCAADGECCGQSCHLGQCVDNAPDCTPSGGLCGVDADCCDRSQQCLQAHCASAP